MIERMERAGKIRANGHHIRQKIAMFAEELIDDTWAGTGTKGTSSSLGGTKSV